ncbi:MAG: hypothetical protein QOJ16_833 [Acidobacteriota bacterium]|jgi:glycosyltransferase involved in cell wall biosynthesis|nr:hypothetical protein [Acidobacteriota bacterium]
MHGAPVLFLPIIEWDFRVQRPQQLARCFARAGERVYYAGLRLTGRPRPPRPVESGIWAVDLPGNPGLDPYRDRLSPADVRGALAALAELAAEHPLAGVWIVVHHPFWRPLAEAARSAFSGALLFDCMDEFSAFADHASWTEEEVALAATADLVAASSVRLHAKLAPHHPGCLLLPNACDPEHFGPAASRRPAGGRPVVGFFGGIHEWFDGPLVAALAAARPEWDFWLVGDTYQGDVRALRDLPNVTFLGELAYSDLPRVASGFDVGIIPFRVNALTEATNPVKVYEMLAAGLPVVATDLPELRGLGPGVAVARTPEEFAARIAEALAEGPAAPREQRERWRRESWAERFLILRQAMAEVSPAGLASPAEWTKSVPTRRTLGLSPANYGAADLKRHVDRLEGDLRAREEERDQLIAQAAEMAVERLSLLEQRDRVLAEAHRLRGVVASHQQEIEDLRHPLRGRLAGRLRSLLGGLG